MVLSPGGLSTWGWRQNAMITIDPERGVVYNPEYYVMRHFARYIQPGAVRRGLCGPWTGNAVAFANPTGEQVIVVNNPFAEARTLTLAGRTLELPGYSFNTLVLE